MAGSLLEYGAEVADHAELGEDERSFGVAVEGPVVVLDLQPAALLLLQQAVGEDDLDDGRDCSLAGRIGIGCARS